MSTSRPYLTKTVPVRDAEVWLTALHAREAARHPTFVVYDIPGSGQVRATRGPSGIRLELFAGRCPC